MSKVPQKWLVVITVLLGTFTIILNNSMLNPSIPYIMNIFDADAVSAGWVITIFMVTMGIAMPVTGYLGDRFGKKQLYMTGLGLFILGSLLGSFSWDLSSLIFFRGLQGIGGGMMMPTSMALIFEVFPKKERGLATGVYGVAAMLAPTIGPTVGGFIIEMGSWQWLFLCNIPTGVLGLVFSAVYLKQTTKVKGITFDLSGFITVTAGVGAMLYALGRMSEISHLKDPLNILLLVAGGIALLFFVRIENKKEQPLLDLSIFKIPAFRYSVWIASISSISLFGGIFLLPLLLQNVYDYSPIVTGLVFLPSALLSGIFMSIGGRILDRRGPGLVVTSGLTIVTITTVLLGFLSLNTALWLIVLFNAVRGIGMGLSTMPATTAGMNAIPEKFISRGSAMNNVLRQMSSALGIVFISVYYEVRKAQIVTVHAHSLEEASLQAINEGFLVVAALSLAVIPLGILLGKEDKKQRLAAKDIKQVHE
ncbi:drug resistance transporter, EmrB/QacA subfamily [Evansella caseinilytica]|uniref:Drug resistance transporter, EmrB/QacA subfamily n=1 Tax=Evansella caseinilytica TaxID=1503961 RepID=A0A1H3TM19_9BACI|nr:MDR family MFS transporter [Evansella caseinilytica]SDZ50861.1 drug resistance transporter, EmrB/QacA subfamily [Evansella caseinilytica]